MSDARLYAGIDLGTSGCRLICIDKNKKIHCSSAIQYPPDSIQTPELWWSSVSKLFVDLSKTIKQQIVALAIDGTSGSILLTDKKGQPTSSTLMYNDLRAVNEAAIIKRQLPITNGGQGASSSLARLLWLLKNESSSSHSHALHQADYILGKLSNNFTLSDDNNCLKLGYDVINRCWPVSELINLKIDLKLLPEVHQVGKTVVIIDKQIAKQFGLSDNVQLVSGTTDSIAAFIATGANKTGHAVTSLGSTLVVKQISDTPIFAPEFGIYSHRFVSNGKDKWLVGGASNTGGKVLRHFFSDDKMEFLSKKVDTKRFAGLDYYPLLDKGERFPIADTNKVPKLTPRPDDDVLFFQALLEGIASIEQQAYGKLEQLGASPIQSVATVGGGHKNPAWTEIRRKLLGVEMIKAVQTEAAYGSALIAMRAL